MAPRRRRGGSQPPSGWSAYLTTAFVISLVLPTAVLLAYATGPATAAQRASAAAALLPLLPPHLLQAALETNVMRRLNCASAIPVAFVVPRLAALARSWALAAGHVALRALVGALALFWLYDTGVVLALLPWTHNAHLLARKTD